jgi:coenzyme F420 hydrogenase subunit beta
MKPNITELIVNQDKCIGCGVCSAICPVDVLPMSFNENGLYQPFEKSGCLDRCTLCLDACPFIEENDSEFEIAKKLYASQKNIEYDKDLGFFLKSYVAHKTDELERLKSASGGGGHWLLSELLKTKVVDKVITVESNKDSDKLFKFSVFNELEELNNTRGSVYYPTELSEVLEYINKNDGNYVITALPCYAKAIRLAQKKNNKLRKRIKYIVGLVCGQMKTKYFTEELGKIAIGTDRLSSINYRVKQEQEPANNFAFEIIGTDNTVGKLNRNDKPNDFWGTRMFTPNACNTCIDTFAETTDIVIMDAWLPEYVKDYRGHVLILVRNEELENILLSSKDLDIREIDHKKVLRSQKGVVVNKKAVALGTKNPILHKIIEIKLKIQKLSNNGEYSSNTKEITLLLLKIKKLQKIQRIISIPIIAINKIHRKIKR